MSGSTITISSEQVQEWCVQAAQEVYRHYGLDASQLEIIDEFSKHLTQDLLDYFLKGSVERDPHKAFEYLYSIADGTKPAPEIVVRVDGKARVKARRAKR